MYLWSSISAASCQGNFFPNQRSSTPLLLIKTSMQRPIYKALVDAFWPTGHLVACHLFAYGRTATACKNIPATHSLVTKAKPPIHTLSASVPQLSETPTHHPQLDTLFRQIFYLTLQILELRLDCCCMDGWLLIWLKPQFHEVRLDIRVFHDFRLLNYSLSVTHCLELYNSTSLFIWISIISLLFNFASESIHNFEI